MLIERCIRRRILWAFLGSLALMLAFHVLLVVRAGVSRSPDGTLSSILGILVEECARRAEILLAITAPAAVLHALTRLRRSGILLVCLAAGFPPSRLRRTLLASAIGVALLAVLAHEAGARAGEERPGAASAWRAGDLWAWSVPTASDEVGEGLVLFRSDTLDAWRSEAPIHRTPGDGVTPGKLEPLTATDLTVERLPGPPPRSATFRSSAPSRWLHLPPSASAFLSFLLLILVGPILLLVCAYFGLLLPRDRLGYAWLGYLMLVAVHGTITMILAVCLRQVPALGPSLSVLYLGGIATLLVTLDRRFQRCGLRLS